MESDHLLREFEDEEYRRTWRLIYFSVGELAVKHKLHPQMSKRIAEGMYTHIQETD